MTSEFFARIFLIVCFNLIIVHGDVKRFLMTTDDLENYISPEDLSEFSHIAELNPNVAVTTSRPSADDTSNEDQFDTNCFGLSTTGKVLQMVFNMKPDTSQNVNTHFYFSSRKKPVRAMILPGPQFGLEWVDFDPKRKTVVIVHGFMSHSNASWINDMASAFLKWGDVNVFAVDWSGGGNTWKYWRAVANTRRVGEDINRFMRQVINATGVKAADFHFVGHSLGAHICSYASYLLGGVDRITGLDPAQPCFRTKDHTKKLDKTDAKFVDVIHTNGRLFSKLGFGIPYPTGHADFYPNGGMQQPGCLNQNSSLISRFNVNALLQQAVCSHGRAYLLFTESLLSSNCSFRAHRWDLTYKGVNASLVAACDRLGSCSEMGITAAGRHKLPKANGAYFVLTTEREPYCPTEYERRHPRPDLLRDLLEGFRLDRTNRTTGTPAGADPEEITEASIPPKSWFWSKWLTSNNTTTTESSEPRHNAVYANPLNRLETTTKKQWFWYKWVNGATTVKAKMKLGSSEPTTARGGSSDVTERSSVDDIEATTGTTILSTNKSAKP